MTVLMADASQRVAAKYGEESTLQVITRDLLFADGTLITEGDAHVVQFYMDTVQEVAKEYGLAFKWASKT